MVICNSYYLEKRRGVNIEMKIAVCGKGGCGKSTVTSLLAKALARRGKEILVIDSDESNYGLHRQLGMKLPRDFTDYFGGKQNVLNDMMLSKFTHQFFEKTWTIDDIPEDYYSLKDGVKLMTSGKIHQANEGCSCAMGTVMTQFIQNLRLTEDQFALMDMEERYRLIMSTIFNAIGCRVEVEKMIATGRIDMVVETTQYIYVLELKLSDNGGVDAAAEQIRAKQYAEPFKADKLKVIALAIELDDRGKGLVDWKEV